MIVFLLTVAASIAALAGGYTALRSRHWLNLALALTSGLVLGLVTFDLLPEIFNIAYSEKLDPVWPMITMTIGFLLFHLFEKIVPLHQANEEQYGPHRHPRLGVARAVALTGHSFLDGLSIGVGFQVSTAVGTAVAIAVIGHRFADGFDTTIFMLFHQNKLSHIRKWLALVIIMPVIGGLASLAFTLSEKTLAIYLGFFAGFLLYIAASNLLPQAHSKNSSRFSTLLTVIGVIFIFIITRLA
jgi:zinc transporter ZupT